MKLDMVNFTIAQFRPLVQQHSVDYEKQKFKSLLDIQKGATSIPVYVLTVVFFSRRTWVSRYRNVSILDFVGLQFFDAFGWATGRASGL